MIREFFGNDFGIVFFYKVLLVAQFVFAVVTFCLLFFITAPYGKHSRKGMGPLVGARIGWVFMEFPAFFVILFLFFFFKAYSNPVLVVFICIWELHYIQRTFVYPFLISKNGKPMSILIPIFGMMFNAMNGYINGVGVFDVAVNGGKYGVSWLYSPQFIVGVAVFVLGFVVNIHSDYVLRHLRKPGETGYKIPNKGVHRLVASPNYLGEFLEWCGWAILTWSVAGAAFAVFTFANLGPRAYKNKLWYRETFGDDYPKKRRAIIPFIF